MTGLTRVPDRRHVATAPLVAIPTMAGEHGASIRAACSHTPPHGRTPARFHAPDPQVGSILNSRRLAPTLAPMPSTLPARRTVAVPISPSGGTTMRRFDCAYPAIQEVTYRVAPADTTPQPGAAGICTLLVRSVDPTAPRWGMAGLTAAGAARADHHPDHTVAAHPRVPNIRAMSRNGVPPMANTHHPLDVAVEEFDTAHRALVRAFVNTGNEIDAIERAALDVVELAHRIVREYRLRQVAGESFARNGDTRLTRERFQDAGHELVDLAAERQARRSNVITFPHRHDHAG